MLSRVADGLYWTSRHLEQAEHTARLLKVMRDASAERLEEDTADAWRRITTSLYQGPPDGFVGESIDSDQLTRTLTFDGKVGGSIIGCLTAARENARQMREQISSEMWEVLNGQYLRLRESGHDIRDEEESGRGLYDEIIAGLHHFQGVTDSTMSHGEGWYFIQLGRFIERGQQLQRLLGYHFGATAPDGTPFAAAPTHFDWVNLLKMCSAFEAFCKVHTANIQADRIAEFLIFDPAFPRSVRFAVDQVQSVLRDIGGGGAGQADRIAGRLRATLDYGLIDDIRNDGIAAFLTETRNQLAAIHYAAHETYIDYRVDAHLSA